MNRKKLRNILITFSLAIVLVCGVFWRPIFANIVEFYFKNISLPSLGMHLKSGEFYFENGLWIIENPFFTTKEPLTAGGLEFRAERIQASINLESFSRDLFMDAVIVKPQIDVLDDLSVLKRMTSEWQPSIFHLRGSGKVDQGIVVVNSFDPLSQILVPKQTIAFDIETSFVKQLEGKITAHFHPEQDEANNALEIAFEQIPGHELTSKLSFQELSCASFSEVVCLLDPSLEQLKLEKGLINGAITLKMRDGKMPEFEGTAKVQDLVFESARYGLKGVIQDASICFDPQANLGKFTFQRNGSLILEKEGKILLEVREGGGEISMQSPEEITITLEGVTRRQQVNVPVHLQGHISILEDSISGFDVHMGLHENDKLETYLHLTASNLDEDLNSMNIALQNIGKAEFEILQLLWGAHNPKWNNVELLGGVFNADLHINFEDTAVKEFQINNFSAKHIAAHLIPWNLALLVENSYGDFSIDLSAENILDTINAQVDIKNGLLRLFDHSQTGWKLQDLATKITVRDGVIQKSLIEGDLSGLKGTIELDWLADHENMKCHFKGGVKDTTFLFPPLFKQVLDTHFVNDQIEVFAAYRWNNLGGKLDGHLNVFPYQPENGKKIAFGCDIEKANANTHQEATFLDDGRLTFSLVDWISRELGISTFLLHNGWFEAYGMPLEKYLSPFLFSRGQAKLRGIGDFKGKLDNQGLMLRYDGKDLVLENNELIIEMSSLNEPGESNPDDPLIGVHYVDFSNGKHFGTMPIYNATYFEKNSGLLFTDIKAKVIFENKNLHIPEIDTYCNGIYFAGAIDLDNSPTERGVFDLKIQSHTMHGKVSQIQSFFSHFKKPIFFLKVPLEGDVDFRKNGSSINFAFSPGKCTFNTKIHGVLSNGSYVFEENNVRLNDFTCNFDYDQQANHLDLWDIHGAILVGEPEQVEEYFLAGDHVRFEDYLHNQSQFDVWIGDKKRDVIRIAGKTQPKSCPGNDGEFVEVLLDHELTHFGDVYPEVFELTVKDWCEIDQFNLRLNFDLATLFSDIQRFNRTGLLFLPGGLQKKINNLKTAKGVFTLDLNYDRDNSQLVYHAAADHVCLGSKQFEKCLLSGKKKGSRWMVDQLLLDQFSCAADISRRPDEWKVNFLGVRYGESLLLGLDGEYRDLSSTFNANINLLEIDLSHLSEWPSLQQSISQADPKGFLKGQGKAHVAQIEGTTDFLIDADINLSSKSLCLFDIHIQDTEPFNCLYQSGTGISLNKVKGHLKDESNQEKLNFSLANLSYVFDTCDYQCQGLEFSIPSDNLAWITKKLNHCMPAIFTEKTNQCMTHLKSDGLLNGNLNLSLAQGRKKCTLVLQDDTYHLFNKDYPLSNLQLEYSDTANLKITSDSLFQQQPIHVIANFANPSLDKGELLLSTPSAQPHVPLSVLWELDSEGHFAISGAQGYLYGLNVHLYRNHQFMPRADVHHLVGEIHFDGSECVKLMPPEVASKMIAWQVGKGYACRGTWDFIKAPQSDNWMDDIHFNGVLEGHNVEFKGYEFQTLVSQVDCTLNDITIQQLHVNDPAGSLHADLLSFNKDHNGSWHLNVPLVTASNFRPSLLRIARIPSLHVVKPFFIKSLTINDVQGKLDELESLQALGYFEFDNGSKRSPLKNTIFAIPAEIISRIGLNPNVMSPVTGTIFFEVHGDRIFLTKLKDVYSEGKLSRFYLSNKPYESYIDFDGNLNLQIRMKQYNLLFKLAELFTVTVTGKLDNPSYSLQKQGKK